MKDMRKKKQTTFSNRVDILATNNNAERNFLRVYFASSPNTPGKFGAAGSRLETINWNQYDEHQRFLDISESLIGVNL